MRKLKFPNEYKEIELNRILSSSEMTQVKQGREPIQMDDKWIIYFTDSWIYFHRFLTGNCIYKMHVICKENHCKVNKVLVNGDSDQYAFDEQSELQFVEEILDLFLSSKL